MPGRRRVEGTGTARDRDQRLLDLCARERFAKAAMRPKAKADAPFRIIRPRNVEALRVAEHGFVALCGTNGKHQDGSQGPNRMPEQEDISVAANAILEDTALAALISSKICHDLAGQIGAINNGLELLEEENDEGYPWN